MTLVQVFLKVFLFSHVTVTVPVLRHVHSSPKICNLSNLTASLNKIMYENGITVFWYLMEWFLVSYTEFNARSRLFRGAFLQERRNSHVLN